VILTHSNEYEPGTWKGLKTPDGRKATFTCPECGETRTLAQWNINGQGEVTPSVICPCGFHEFLRLEGWKP
jgi:predicted RNA-binding Zn-ribbon protein involved in translation (DUF1610 family)